MPHMESHCTDIFFEMYISRLNRGYLYLLKQPLSSKATQCNGQKAAWHVKGYRTAHMFHL